ncbi:MAG: two component transcriptional regulator, LuxR family [Firmicutes bacterium]|nr:two component transcriptional regulator, LuxR family [Bacillota bacterium]
MTKIIIADDHAILRTGLKLMLSCDSSIDVVGEVNSGEELLTLLETVTADVLILDLSLPGMNGIDVIYEIKNKGYLINILVLTMHTEEQYIKAVMNAGALGYVSKSAFDTELLTAVRTVAEGKIYLNSSNALLMVNTLLNGSAKEPDTYALLSTREREVMRLLVHGYSLAEIGKLLCLSIKTIDTHKTRIMTKLGIAKKNELVQYALNHGILVQKNESI